MVNRYWKEIPGYYKDVALDEFVVMPNHIHGIIIIGTDVGTEQCSVPGSYASNLDSITRLGWPFETWDSGLANASVSLDDMLLGKSANLDSNVPGYRGKAVLNSRKNIPVFHKWPAGHL